MILMKQYRYTSADVCGPGYTIKRYYHRFYAKNSKSSVSFKLSVRFGFECAPVIFYQTGKLVMQGFKKCK